MTVDEQIRVEQGPQVLSKLQRLYIDWMRTCNYSEATMDGKYWRIKRFIAWCDERDVIFADAVNEELTESYRLHLFNHRRSDGKPLSFRTQYLHLCTLKNFFKWAEDQGYMAGNPAEKLPLPKLAKHLPLDILNPFEVEEVMGQVSLGKRLGYRDRAILEVFYATGIRRAELINLRVYDIDMERELLFVRRGKGMKDRVVPLGKRALFWLDLYQREMRPSLVGSEDSGHLFLTFRGTAMGKKRLSDMVSGYVGMANLGKRGSCHLLRHSMATAMLEGGADTRYIQQMLGHADLSSTQIYTKVTVKKLREVHADTHPGERGWRQNEAGNDRNGTK